MSSSGDLDEGGIQVRVSVRAPRKGQTPSGKRDMVQTTSSTAVDPAIMSIVDKAERAEAKRRAPLLKARAKMEGAIEKGETSTAKAMYRELKEEMARLKREAKIRESNDQARWRHILSEVKHRDKEEDQRRRKFRDEQARFDKARERVSPGAMGRRVLPEGRDAKGRLLPLRPGSVSKAGKRANVHYPLGRGDDPEDPHSAIPDMIDGILDEDYIPENWVHKIARGQVAAEKRIRSVRTKTQRLQTYGLWFVETAQHNPAYTAGKVLLNTMRLAAPPYGMVLSSIIASIVSSAVVIPETIRNMSKKGKPWNIDWHRAISEEVVGMFSLEEQKRRDLGLHGVISDPIAGFSPVDGTDVYNNQMLADSIRLNKLRQDDKARRLY